MQKDEISAKAQKILDYIDSKDPTLQSIALKTLEQLLAHARINSSMKERIVNAIGRELAEGDPSTKNELVSSACVLGKHDLDIARKFAPALFAELDGRNRYRIGSVTDFLARKATANDDVVKQGIQHLFRVAGSWLSDPNLAPIFEKFIDVASENNTRFVALHRAEIDEFLKQLPPGSPGSSDVRASLLQKLKAHDDFVLQEQQRRKAEEAEEKARQQQAAELAAARAAKERARREEIAARTSLSLHVAPQLVKSGPIPAVQQKPSPAQPALPASHSKAEAVERTVQEASPSESSFSTFSTMGLKRKRAPRDSEPASPSA